MTWVVFNACVFLQWMIVACVETILSSAEAGQITRQAQGPGSAFSFKPHLLTVYMASKQMIAGLLVIFLSNLSKFRRDVFMIIISHSYRERHSVGTANDNMYLPIAEHLSGVDKIPADQSPQALLRGRLTDHAITVFGQFLA